MDLLINSSHRRAVTSLWDTRAPKLPTLQAGDTLPLAIGEVVDIGHPFDSRLFAPQDSSGVTYRAAIGKGFLVPVDGTFSLTWGANTTDDLEYNAADYHIQTELNALASIAAAGGVEVSGETGFFIVTWNNVGARALITADAGDLVPASLVDIAHQVEGDVSTRAVQVIRIVQSAAAIATLSTASASAGIAVTTVQTGDSTHNHQVRVTMTGDIYLGTWSFSLAGVPSEPIGYDDTPGQIKRALEAIPGLGAGNVSVDQEGERTFLITFIGELATTPLGGISVNGTNLVALQKKSGTLPLTSAAVQMLLNGSEAKVVNLEVERQEGADAPEKILSRAVLLTRPLIEPAMTDTGGAVEAADIAAAIATYSGSGTLVTVSAVGTTDLAPATAFFQWSQRVVVQAGAGPYTHKFTLDNARAIAGARYYVALEIAASANPTIQFYNDAIGGTLLQTISGDSNNAQYVTAVFVFQGGAWVFDGFLR